MIPKRIVAEAERTGRGIALESLQGIRDRARLRKPQRAALHSWAFAQLGQFICYKARRAGVLVVYVDPAYTSRMCADCGHVDKATPVWGGWEELEGAVTAFRDAAREAGRDPDELPVVLRVNEPFTDRPAGGEASPAGSPEQLAGALPRLERLGVSEVFWGMEFHAPEQLQQMGRLLKLVGRGG